MVMRRPRATTAIVLLLALACTPAPKPASVPGSARGKETLEVLESAAETVRLHPHGFSPRLPIHIPRSRDADANACPWRSSGPTNLSGRVTGIAVDPTDRQRIFVTTVGGVWRTLDGARHWRRVSDNFVASVTASVAINPAKPQEVFVGGGDPDYACATTANAIGIWRSTAGGDPDSWQKANPANPELDTAIIYRLRIDPAGTNDVYAATSAGLYIGRHEGAGITWTKLHDGETPDVAVDFSRTPRLVYATTANDSAIWKWDGATWTRADSGIPLTKDSSSIGLALSPSHPERLYAIVAVDDSTMAVYATSDGAVTWSEVPGSDALNYFNNQWQSFPDYAAVIEVDPSDPDVVYAGGVGLFRYRGGKWDEISAGADASWPQSIHVDQHALAFDPVDPSIVYSGNDGGIDVTTSTSAATWRWQDISHGMTTTEFYAVDTQRATATLIAGASQDNGTEITFGNLTWYNPGRGDSIDVAVDSANSETVYSTSSNTFVEGFTNPVPGTPGGRSTMPWMKSYQFSPPLATNPTAPPGRAVLTHIDGCNPVEIYKTEGGMQWSRIATLPEKHKVDFLAVAPNTNFQVFYAGVSPAGCDQLHVPVTVPQCGMMPLTMVGPRTVWRTRDGGQTWLKDSEGLPKNLALTGADVDPKNPDRVIVFAAGAGIYLTTDGGAHWAPVPSATEFQAQVNDGVLDPIEPATLYVATNAGVFKGRIAAGANGAPTVTWTSFNNGLPDGLNVTSITANGLTGLMTIGTTGYGTFQRSLGPGSECTPRRLLVRDNVFDKGFVPSPRDVPDPEHPIPDPERSGFYKPDDTPGGRLQWWTSTDIRIDVPAVDPPQNQLTAVDHVRFESCPPEVGKCPVDTLRDSPPSPGANARAYVQVSNRGTEKVRNVRVMLLYTDATTALPPLPPSFWTQSLPKAGPCGPLDPSTGWKYVDPATPCLTIDEIDQRIPEVVGFDWNVPSTAAEHSSFVAIVDSPEDPIDTRELEVWKLAPWQRHVGVRSLYIVDPPLQTTEGAWEWAELLLVPNPGTDPWVTLELSTAGDAKDIHVFVPTLQGVAKTGMTEVDVTLTDEERETATAGNLDTSKAMSLAAGATALLRLPIPPGETWRIMLSLRTTGTARISITERQGTNVFGGSTYVFRGSGK